MSYSRPYSSKNLQQLIEQIRLGPLQPLMLTEEEKILKYTFWRLMLIKIDQHGNSEH